MARDKRRQPSQEEKSSFGDGKGAKKEKIAIPTKSPPNVDFLVCSRGKRATPGDVRIQMKTRP